MQGEEEKGAVDKEGNGAGGDGGRNTDGDEGEFYRKSMELWRRYLRGEIKTAQELERNLEEIRGIKEDLWS